MKKAKQIHKTSGDALTPEQTLQFLEDFRAMVTGQDQTTKMISLRVPENVLNSFKVKAKGKNFKYQSVIIQLMRKWAQEN